MGGPCIAIRGGQTFRGWCAVREAGILLARDDTIDTKRSLYGSEKVAGFDNETIILRRSLCGMSFKICFVCLALR